MSFLRPIPDWRVGLVWRLYGWAGLQQVWVLGGPMTWSDWFVSAPWVIHGLTACSILLVLFGARPVSFLATGIVTSSLLWITASGTSRLLNFPGAELPLFMALPVGSTLLWAVASRAKMEPAELTRGLLGLYRIAFVVEMGFAALHKMNRDFFDPALSCAGVLNEMLPQWWDTPFAALARFLDPPVVVALEGGTAILTVLYWPVGLLVTLGFLVGLAMVGPTGFTAVSIAAAFSFVRGTTAESFYRVPRRWPVVCASVAVALVGYVAWAYAAPPQYPWRQFAVYVVVVAFLGVCVAGELVRDLRGGRVGGLPSAVRFDGPRSGALRVLLVSIAAIGVVNGLTPYFGYKYHFSYSMLSNLRADGVRWNSYVVPRWLRLVDQDPFVEVTRFEIDRADGPATDPDRELLEASFPPYEFRRRVYYHLRNGQDVDVWIRYQGRERAFQHLAQNPEGRAFLEGLPRTLLFQKVLLSGPQSCVH